MEKVINLQFKGMLAVSTADEPDSCVIGFVKNPPPYHPLVVTVTRKEAGTPDTFLPVGIPGRFELEVRNAPKGVTMREPGFKIDRRKKPVTHPSSTEWFMDFDRLYEAEIGIDANYFYPTLTFDSGELFTMETSKDFLWIQDGIHAPHREFGMVALQMGVDVEFDVTTSAVFRNDGRIIFDTATHPNAGFIIKMTQDFDTTMGGVLPEYASDANYYYPGVGSALGLDEESRKLFLSMVKAGGGGAGPAGPEAACFFAYFSRSRF